mmetsp:Transcript_7082/g.23248  ORF Transcript_7082/g.23248 Transcript_7082/m.23248 type:complete len:261 (+) Transcript_7082:743-1525(+)
MSHVRRDVEGPGAEGCGGRVGGGGGGGGQAGPDAADGVAEERALCAGGRLGPNLLMVEQTDQPHKRVSGERGQGLDERLCREVARALVVEPARQHELVMQASEGGGLCVRQLQLKIDDIGRRHSEGPSQQIDQRRVVPLAAGRIGRLDGLAARRVLLVPQGVGQRRREQGRRLSLQVWLEAFAALVGCGQVDGEVGDACNRLVHAHKHRVQPAFRALPDEHSPGQAQITVEPRVPQAAAVPDHAKHDAPFLLERRRGFEL